MECVLELCRILWDVYRTCAGPDAVRIGGAQGPVQPASGLHGILNNVCRICIGSCAVCFGSVSGPIQFVYDPMQFVSDPIQSVSELYRIPYSVYLMFCWVLSSVYRIRAGSYTVCIRAL